MALVYNRHGGVAKMISRILEWCYKMGKCYSYFYNFISSKIILIFIPILILVALGGAFVVFIERA